MLHVTNGESVIRSFRAASIPGSYLSWFDALHDGPVPFASTLDALANVRAEALSHFGWGAYDHIRSAFAARDRAIADFRRHDEVVLWFEHDLYDQLQLVQLLDWFSGQVLASVRLSLIQINAYPGVQSFYGLGQLTGAQLAGLLPTRKPVTAGQLAIAREVWQAFRAPDPAVLVELTGRELPEMPFLGAALGRFLEEYPSVHDGLSRLERQIVRAAAPGHMRRQEIYQGSQQPEECRWGDASVYWRIEALASVPVPALDRTTGGDYAVSEIGRQLLAGTADWIRARGGIDVWLGGVHLRGTEARWRWNNDERALTA
jgi:hypothetical protein